MTHLMNHWFTTLFVGQPWLHRVCRLQHIPYTPHIYLHFISWSHMVHKWYIMNGNKKKYIVWSILRFCDNKFNIQNRLMKIQGKYILVCRTRQGSPVLNTCLRMQTHSNSTPLQTQSLLFAYLIMQLNFFSSMLYSGEVFRNWSVLPLNVKAWEQLK